MPHARSRMMFPHCAGLSPAWRGKPHHMTGPEMVLMYAWLDTSPRGLKRIWYDVAMDGVPAAVTAAGNPPTDDDGKYQRMWQRLNAKRCDAILDWGLDYQIVELRPRVVPQTIGELHQYRYLSAAEWPNLMFRRPMLITSIIDYMLRATVNASDIELVVLADRQEQQQQTITSV